MKKETATGDKKGLLLKILQGDLLEKEVFQKNLLFLTFLAGIGIIYISFSYRTVNLVKQIERLEVELRELRSESISLKNQLRQTSRKFQIAQKLAATGMVIPKTPPRVITLSKDSLDLIY
jgi:cell division protein FtsL